jgi:hypothetical protein
MCPASRFRRCDFFAPCFRQSVLARVFLQQFFFFFQNCKKQIFVVVVMISKQSSIFSKKLDIKVFIKSFLLVAGGAGWGGV